MPRVSSSVMVKEAGTTDSEFSSKPVAVTEPRRVTVSSSSSTSSFTGLNRNVAVALVLPAGITISKDSTSWKSPRSAVEPGSNVTRTVVSTSSGSTVREVPTGVSAWKEAVTVTSRAPADSGTLSKASPMNVRTSRTSDGATRSSSTMVAVALVVVPSRLAR